MSEPHPDPYWRDVIEAIGGLSLNGGRLVAPAEFGGHLPDAISYDEASRLAPDEIAAIVIHKGWTRQLPTEFLSRIVERLTPCFANPVFVVFAPGDLPAAARPHVDAFLTEHRARVAEECEDGPAPRTFHVYLGRGRMLVRDPEFRKIVVPSPPSLLLARFAQGENVVGSLGERLRPAIAGARSMIDIGTGFGLFLLAAKALADDHCLTVAIETDEALSACARFNIDLAGLYWMTELVPSFDAPRERQFVERNAALARNAREQADVIHIDIAASSAPPPLALAKLARTTHAKTVLLSHGLTTRLAPDAGTRFETMTDALTVAGYTFSALGDGDAEIRVFGRA